MDSEFPDKHQVADVLAMLKKSKLKEGHNVIHKTASGEQISANFKDGRIIGWLVHDKEGTMIPTIPTEGTNKDGEITCWICYRVKGQKHCFRIVCPWD